MKKLIYLVRPFTIFCVLVFILLMLTFPRICTAGAASGLLLCGQVIIPSLFPFTFCVLFLMRSGAMKYLHVFEPFSRRVLHQSTKQFSVMLLSFIGGYPVGARLINELYESGSITRRQARIMQCYCINAGPAFIVLAVGEAMLHSKEIGYLLLTAHITASFLLAIIFARFLPKTNKTARRDELPISVTQNFVKSAADAAATVFGICGYIILFATINSYVNTLAQVFPPLQFFKYISEVTIALANIKNVYVIAFIAGFAGLCVWCQVLAVSANVGINLPLLVLSRILHGVLSSGILFCLLKIFPVSVPTMSNNRIFIPRASYSTVALSVALISMALLFVISLAGKKHTGKITDDLI